MVLVVGLAAIGDAVFLDLTVSADIENRRQSPLTFSGNVEIAGDVQAGARLEMQLFDEELLVLDAAGDYRFQWCPRRTRRQSEHLEELTAVACLVPLPVLESLDLGQALVGQASGPSPEVVVDHPVTRRGLGGLADSRRREHQADGENQQRAVRCG